MIEPPWPPYLAVCYIATVIPFSMNPYLSLWQDYYQTDELWMEYHREDIEPWGMPWDIFLEHLEELESHGLLEYELTNGSVQVLLEECVPEEIKNYSGE
jgi:hypothetical protein